MPSTIVDEWYIDADEWIHVLVRGDIGETQARYQESSHSCLELKSVVTNPLSVELVVIDVPGQKWCKVCGQTCYVAGA